MYDHEEQEQIEAIKGWFRRYGKLVALGAVAAGVVLAAGLGFKAYKKDQSEKASALYVELEKSGSDLKKLKAAAASLISSYPKTAYASRAALIVAKAESDSGESNEARTQLKWVLDNSTENELKDVARLRLARMVFDEKKYQEAQALLDAPHEDSFDGLYSDLKGDVLAAQGQLSQAKSAYVLGLNKMEKNSPYRNLVQMKIDSLGGVK